MHWKTFSISGSNLCFVLPFLTQGNVQDVLEADALILGAPGRQGGMCGEMRMFLDTLAELQHAKGLKVLHLFCRIQAGSTMMSKLEIVSKKAFKPEIHWHHALTEEAPMVQIHFFIQTGLNLEVWVSEAITTAG